MPDAIPHVFLRRPQANADRAAILRYRERQAAALIEMGVDYGDGYVLIPASAFTEKSSIDDLGEQLGPFARDSDTSREAAIRAFPKKKKTAWRIVLAIMATGERGYTRAEVADALSIPDSSADGRISELIGGGFLRESGRTRPTKHGSQASVVIATTLGCEEARRHGARSGS